MGGPSSTASASAGSPIVLDPELVQWLQSVSYEELVAWYVATYGVIPGLE